MKYDARSRTDMRALALKVQLLDPSHEKDLAATIMSTDLMRTHLWLTGLVKLQVWFRGRSLYAAWRNVFERLPTLATETVTAFVEHIENGRDTYQWDSAAGLCQAEVVIVEGLIERFSK